MRGTCMRGRTWKGNDEEVEMREGRVKREECERKIRRSRKKETWENWCSKGERGSYCQLIGRLGALVRMWEIFWQVFVIFWGNLKMFEFLFESFFSETRFGCNQDSLQKIINFLSWQNVCLWSSLRMFESVWLSSRHLSGQEAAAKIKRILNFCDNFWDFLRIAKRLSKLENLSASHRIWWNLLNFLIQLFYMFSLFQFYLAFRLLCCVNLFLLRLRGPGITMKLVGKQNYEACPFIKRRTSVNLRTWETPQQNEWKDRKKFELRFHIKSRKWHVQNQCFGKNDYDWTDFFHSWFGRHFGCKPLH